MPTDSPFPGQGGRTGRAFQFSGTPQNLEFRGAASASPAQDEMEMEHDTSQLDISISSLASVDVPESFVVQNELRAAVKELSEHGLIHSAKWAAEMATGLGEITAGVGQGQLPSRHQVPADEDAVALARCYMDVREYRRAAHTLLGFTSHRAVFLRGYSLYLAGEKRRAESTGAQGAEGGNGGGAALNPELKDLQKELSMLQAQNGLDGLGFYLLGITLKGMDLEADARTTLAQAARAYPLNWGAWLELASLCRSHAQVDELDLGEHWMRLLFLAQMDLELQSNKQALAKYTQLQDLFPESHYIVSQMALAHYNMRDFTEAQEAFERILQHDPFRLDNMDTYSNILYVQEHKMQLSVIAHSALKNEKYRPETCCIIGNYYSLKSQHEKAVLYFKRALQLNHQYLSAWTLMGHEYVEMRNTAATPSPKPQTLNLIPETPNTNR